MSLSEVTPRYYVYISVLCLCLIKLNKCIFKDNYEVLLYKLVFKMILFSTQNLKIRLHFFQKEQLSAHFTYLLTDVLEQYSQNGNELNRYEAGYSYPSQLRPQPYTHRSSHNNHLLVYTLLMGGNNGPVPGLLWQFMMDVKHFNWE